MEALLPSSAPAPDGILTYFGSTRRVWLKEKQ